MVMMDWLLLIWIWDSVYSAELGVDMMQRCPSWRPAMFGSIVSGICLKSLVFPEDWVAFPQVKCSEVRPLILLSRRSRKHIQLSQGQLSNCWLS